MKRFTVIANAAKDINLTVSTRAIRFLEEQGCTCVRIDPQTDIEACRKIIADTECILVVGGDGSIIRTVRRYASLKLPFIGINMGRVGYLAEIEPETLYADLEALLKDQGMVEPRMLLEGSFDSTDSGMHMAVNDIVISRGGSANLIKYTIYVNGERLYTYNGDGVILSTPAGSTGYSMAAGGPIVSPRAKMILVTPVCAMTLNSRSVLLSAEDEIRIAMTEDQPDTDAKASVFFDGQLRGTMLPGDSLLVKKSKKTYDMIRIKKESFLEKLRKKMSD